MIFKVIDTITGLEPDIERIALDEEWASNLVYCDIQGFAITEDDCLMLTDDCGNLVFPPMGRFRIEWTGEKSRHV